MNFFDRPIHHINLTVADIEKSLEFYKNTLGFKEEYRFIKGKRKFVYVSNGTTLYEFIEDTTMEMGTHSHVAYTSTDIQKDYQYFKDLGCPMFGPVGFISFLFENGAYYFFVETPSGEKVEFVQRK